MIYRLPARSRASTSAAALAGAALLLLPGCASEPKKPTEPVAVAPAPAKPLPPYAQAAEQYNQRLSALDRLIARATMRFSYLDKEGERRTEAADGTLQIVRPARLSLNLDKLSKRLFWFGSDEARYWWFDLTDSDDRWAAVGSHDRFDATSAGRRLGIPLRPLDLIAATGIVPLDPQAPGVTQWSRDGERLGLAAPLGAPTARPGAPARPRGYQRVWVDPRTMLPLSIELFDADRRPVLRADHAGEERVEITRTGIPGGSGARPRIPSQITVHLPESETDIRITLTDAKDGPVSDKAFVFDELRRRLNVDRVIDLDQPAPAPGGPGRQTRRD